VHSSMQCSGFIAHLFVYSCKYFMTMVSLMLIALEGSGFTTTIINNEVERLLKKVYIKCIKESSVACTINIL
jgi:hypothetical protein